MRSVGPTRKLYMSKTGTRVTYHQLFSLQAGSDGPGPNGPEAKERGAGVD